jgi:hypothetical protein
MSISEYVNAGVRSSDDVAPAEDRPPAPPYPMEAVVLVIVRMVEVALA